MAKEEQKKNKIGIIIFIMAMLFIFTLIFSVIVGFFVPGDDVPVNANTIIIPINGVIVSEGSSGFLDDSSVSSMDIVEEINKANSNPNIKAVIFDINSPGGSGVAAEEIANAITNLNKTKVAFIRDIGASAAYWIASSTDKIYASRFSFVGSVGVISSYVEVEGLLDKFNLTYRRLVAGEYKDIGSPLKEMTKEEQKLWQNKLDSLHDIFIDEIKNNRNLNDVQIKEISTAMIYTGVEAKELNLIDEFGGRIEALKYVSEEIKEESIPYEIKKESSILDILAGSSSQGFYNIGKGIGNTLKEDNQKAII